MSMKNLHSPVHFGFAVRLQKWGEMDADDRYVEQYMTAMWTTNHVGKDDRQAVDDRPTSRVALSTGGKECQRVSI